ncbi:MAG: choice-of-anchor D domain-containing protein [Candidatus Kapaibacterium sp.]
MRNLFYTFLIILLVSSVARLDAQNRFSISEVNTDEFPYVRASFIATNQADEPFENLVPEDFKIVEDGVTIPSGDIEIDCIDSVQYPALSILMILDQSESMNEIDTTSNQRRWEWVKEGVHSFIRSIRYDKNENTMIAMTSFHGGAVLRCPWTRDTVEFKDSLRKIIVAGRTLYDPAFFDPAAGAISLLRQRPANIRRVAIFLTDGRPDESPRVDSIVNELQRNNIQCYSITVAMPMTDDLKVISHETGGKSYAADTKQKLNDIYRIIAADIQKIQLCDIIWKTEYACDNYRLKRNVNITFKRIGITRDLQYEAPPNGIASVSTNSDLVYFGNPNPGPANAVTEQLVLSPVNSSFTITGMKIIPPGYFEVQWDGNPIEIAEGDEHTLDIKFTQENDKLYRQATLIVEGLPCPPQVTLVGGVSQINIIEPNGGEVYSTCDTVPIKWGGVEDTSPVILSYRVNESSPWQTIKNNATGLIHKWLPPMPSDEYRVRASVSPEFSYMWLKSFGGTENDVANSIAVQDDDLYFYVTGHYQGNCGFGNDTLRANKGEDIFLTKHNIDGSVVWALTAGGPGTDTAAGVCVDPNNNAYITGVIYNGARFGSMIHSLPISDVPYFFVARYPSTGAAPTVRWIGATDMYTRFRAGGTKIRYSNGDIYVQGQYTGTIQHKGFGLPDRTNPQRFTAVYSGDDFSLKNLYIGGENYDDYSKAEDMDSDGNVYTCGTYENTKSFGTHTISSAGMKDIFINKYGGTPGSEDISDAVFKVGSPVLEFTENSRDLGDCIISQTEYHSLQGILTNTGDLTAEIANTSFIGANPDDFALDQNLIGKQIPAGGSIDIQINFMAKDVGTRNAQLRIEGVCAEAITLNLTGNGICSGEVISEIDFGNVSVNMSASRTFDCIFKNTNYSILRIDPIILGTNAAEFDWEPKGAVNLQPGECFKMTIHFTPTAFGDHTAYIDYQMNEACEQKITNLKGYGENADINVTSIDWDRRRVQTVNDSFLVVNNNTSQPVNISNIYFEDPENDIKLFADFPREIPAYDTIRVPVSFRPVAEQINTNTVLLEVSALPDPMRAPVRGVGYLPKLDAQFICGDAVKTGESTIATLRLQNPSTSSELTIDEIRFETTTPEFQWADGNPPGALTIDSLSSEEFDIVFAPAQAGLRTANIIITSDAAPGPEENPRVDTEVSVECDALGVEYESPVDFGNLMICSDDTKSIDITNHGSASDLVIDSYTLSGPDADAFAITGIDPDWTIAGGDTRSFNIRFSPIERRDYEATLVLNNNLGFDITFELRGTGEIIDLTVENKTIDAEPGQSNKLSVLGKLPKIANDPITSITMRIVFNPTMVRFEEATLKSSMNNWTWSNPQLIDDGVLEVNGSGTLPTPFDLELFNIKFFIYLGNTMESSIAFRYINNECSTEETIATDINIAKVCFLDGRLITVSGSKYALYDPAPNPAGETVNIKYGVGFEAMTTVGLYNSMGQLVRTIVSERLKPGLYEQTIPTAELGSGVYLLKMESGPYMKTQRIVISK